MWTGVKVPGIESLLRGVLDQWKGGIDAPDPQSVAAAFTDDAIFQGLRPYSVGPRGVFAFHDRDPVELRLGVVVVRTDGGWRIAYYQASPAAD
ncbi:conserved hypothetical protein [uncultured Mycobacterium sp.]|uniref:SnoaL-like domain-containing protein n=1 Tax=uncultured Mycobacterium sp. TaxID=171292 RepID=A0A1Y5PBK4_9MYCO|nr:conserved hypothetical protein [uncultured Mycobacterium sp.]